MSTRTRLLVSTLALAASAGVPAATPAVAGGGFVVRLYASGHHPKVNRNFPIRITAQSSAGKPVRADVRYEYLFGGQVVARRSHYYFRGTFRDNLVFPARAVGIRLVFRAVVHSSLGTVKRDWWVQVVR